MIIVLWEIKNWLHEICRNIQIPGAGGGGGLYTWPIATKEVFQLVKIRLACVRPEPQQPHRRRDQVYELGNGYKYACQNMCVYEQIRISD